MPYSINIDHKLKIIKNSYTGIISKKDLANVWRHLLSLEEFKELRYNLLSDYRNSGFDIPKSEGDSMIQFLLSIKDILNSKKEGVILRNPKDTALAMLLQRKIYGKIGYKVELFSTEKAAMDWLNNTNNK